MSRIPEDLRYSSTHQWARPGADGLVVVGITDHAQEALGDVLFCELPAVGTRFAAGEQSGTVESLKAAYEVYAPVAGEVVALNEALNNVAVGYHGHGVAIGRRAHHLLRREGATKTDFVVEHHGLPQILRKLCYQRAKVNIRPWPRCEGADKQQRLVGKGRLRERAVSACRECCNGKNQLDNACHLLAL